MALAESARERLLLRARLYPSAGDPEPFLARFFERDTGRLGAYPFAWLMAGEQKAHTYLCTSCRHAIQQQGNMQHHDRREFIAGRALFPANDADKPYADVFRGPAYFFPSAPPRVVARTLALTPLGTFRDPLASVCGPAEVLERAKAVVPAWLQTR